MNVFSINLDLFDPVGALLLAILVAFIYGQRQKLSWWPALDALTPLFATLAVGLSLSHLAAGTAFGKPTALPWAIELWNANRHPTQIYELAAALVILGILWFRKSTFHAGSDFLLWVALMAAARLVLEAFRGDSKLVLGGLRLAQIIAWMVLAAAIFVRELRLSREKVP